MNFFLGVGSGDFEERDVNLLLIVLGVSREIRVMDTATDGPVRGVAAQSIISVASRR